MMALNVFSIYSGAGGLDLGFVKEGYTIRFSTDYWSKACDTLSLNGHSERVLCDDIRMIDFKTIKSEVECPVHCLIGGPPCPAYSKSRFYRKEKKRGIEDEEYGFTLDEYLRAVEELEPEVFVFENVHGFIYKPHREAFELLARRSNELGYSLSWQVVNSADYGVPQTRQRFICVGTRLGLNPFVFPTPTHIDPAKEQGKDSHLGHWVTCRDAIGDLDVPLDEDEYMQAGSKHKDLLKLVPPGDNYLYFTKERGHPNPIFKWRSRYWSFLLKLSPDRPAWTIQASHSNNMGPFHWRNRFLRISEIKRLQTFDDNYQILGNFRDQWRQVGNAVPPLLAQVLAASIKRQFWPSLCKYQDTHKTDEQLQLIM